MDKEYEGVVIQGFDVIDVLGFIDKKLARYIAVALNELEEIFEVSGIGKDSEEYQLVRKLILDLMNNYTRSILRVIFGDIESATYKKNYK